MLSRLVITCPRSEEAPERSNPTSKEWWLRGEEGQEELLPIQGQEGWP